MPYLLFIPWLILGIQIVFITLFLAAFSKRKQIHNTSTPPVSIIVCAHDEEQNIRELVPLLLKQDYPAFEVIVVEDRSNDETYDYLLESTKKHPALRMVRVTHLPPHVNGKKFALTLGIKAAVNEWLLFTDADCRPESDQWIRTMTSSFGETRQIVIGYSPFRRAKGYLNSFIRFESLITGIQYMGLALLGNPYMGVGRNLAYRKGLFLDNKGFKNYLSVTGGDDDLFVNEHATRQNTTINMARGSLMVSIPKRTLREYLVQKLRHMSAGKRYRFRDKFLLGLFSSSWVLTWMVAAPACFIASPVTTFVWTGFVFRELLLMVLIRHASRSLGSPFEWWKTPYLDFNYAIYYLGTGLTALISKRIRWKI